MTEAPPRPRDDAIVVEHLTKDYRVYATPLDALKEVVTGRPRHEVLRALDDVSLRVRRGERLGIIGANGAGKSTLLKILSGTIDATSGRFAVSGRLRAILELGTGFHPESTGRENIMMGGLCMGYTRAELDARLEWIVDFSELGPAIDRPVRTYSSGMRQRLMYAVAFCLPVEIMVVDEALAAGDGAFGRKCTNHIVELCSGGSTALLVSHNLYFLERMCDRVVYLRRGRLVGDGEPLEVCKQYEDDMGRDFVTRTLAQPLPAARESVGFVRAEPGVHEAVAPGDELPATPAEAQRDPPNDPRFSMQDPPGDLPRPGKRQHNGTGEVLGEDGTWSAFDFTGAPAVRHRGWVRLRAAEVYDGYGRRSHQLVVGQPARFRFVIESRVRKRDVHVGIMILSEHEHHVGTTTNVCSLDWRGRPNGIRYDLREGLLEVEAIVPSLRLGAGQYFVKFGVATGFEHFSDDDLLCCEWRCLSWSMVRPDTVKQVLYDPISRWTPMRRIGGVDALEVPDAAAAAPTAERPG